jgi:hypothetical protein
LEWNWNPTISNWIPIGKSWNKTMEPTIKGDKEERGEDGSLLPGNAGGPGNPYARKVRD